MRPLAGFPTFSNQISLVYLGKFRGVFFVRERVLLGFYLIYYSVITYRPDVVYYTHIQSHGDTELMYLHTVKDINEFIQSVISDGRHNVDIFAVISKFLDKRVFGTWNGSI